MELIRYWRVIRRKAWLIILCPLVAAVAAGLISLQLPKIYEAQGVLYVRTALLLPPSLGGVAPATSDQVLRSYADLMVLRPQLEQVISEESLPIDPVSLSKRVTVTPRPNTLLLDLAVRDTDPGRAARTANRLANDFVDYVNSQPSVPTSGAAGPPQESISYRSPAILPTEPVSPKPFLNVTLGILAGLVVGFGLAFFLDYLDQSVRSDEILRERVGLVPLGHIAYVPAKGDRRGELVALGADSPVVEAYKALRTNLLFSSVDREVKTIVITSAGPNEGKSRTAANLAIVLAQAGHSTLLLDADFRRPSQHRIFGRVRNIGLSNLIVQDMPESAVFVADEQIKNLIVMASGPTPPNPSELLGSAQMNALFARFRKGFDYVVIDTPPVNAVTDASVIAANADAAILVVDTNKATYPAVQHAKQALERVGSKVIGTVMNKMKAAGGSYYYNNYGYNYVAHPNGKPAVARITTPTEEETPLAGGKGYLRSPWSREGST